jgi:hypothetical protein
MQQISMKNNHNPCSLLGFIKTCTKNKLNGIGMIDSFTGSHKTSSIIDYLSDYIKGEKTTFRTIYYITPRLSNLKETHKELLEKIDPIDHASILKIDSNMETLSSLSHSEYQLLRTIFQTVCASSELNSTEKKKLKSIKDNLIIELQKLYYLKSKSMSDYYRYELSKDHIRSIYKNLENIFSDLSYTKFTSLLGRDELYFFEKTFFPSMLIRKKNIKIVFASTQKILSGLIEPKGLFLPFQYEQDSLFILDESDAQYQEMVSFLSKKQQYNLYDHLKQVVMSMNMTPGIKQGTYYNYDNFSFNEHFQNFKQHTLQPFISKYNPYLNIEYQKLDEEPFEDIHFLLDVKNNLYSQNEKKYNYQTDLNAFNNYITADDTGLSMQEFIEDAHKFIDQEFSLFFYQLFRAFFVNYKRDNQEDKILFNNLFVTLLKDLNLYFEQDIYHSSSFYNRLKENIQNLTLNDDSYDGCFYSKSFKYTSIIQKSEEHSATINSIYVPYSPNHILNKLATRNFVFLSSATADNTSVVHNFDIKYLKKQMQENNFEFMTLPQPVLNHLNSIRNGYKDSYSNISCNAITENFREKEYVEKWFAQENLTKKECNLLLNSPHDTEIYYKRFYSLLQSFMKFINHDHKYGIFFLPKLYQDSDGVALLMKLLNRHSSSPINIYSVNASDIKKNIFEDVIWPKFSSNKDEKAIILTHYNTMSSGINIQRPMFESDQMMDIDFMFFELPTDLMLPSFTKEKGQKQSLVTAIFHLQSLFINDQLSERDYQVALGSLMKNINQGSLLYLNKLYKKTDDYKMALWKIIEQAIGRMSRTKNKHSRVQIMLSNLLFVQLKTIDFKKLDTAKSSFEISCLKELF